MTRRKIVQIRPVGNRLVRFLLPTVAEIRVDVAGPIGPTIVGTTLRVDIPFGIVRQVVLGPVAIDHFNRGVVAESEIIRVTIRAAVAPHADADGVRGGQSWPCRTAQLPKHLAVGRPAN